MPNPGRTSCEIRASLRSPLTRPSGRFPSSRSRGHACLPGATDDDRDPVEPAHQHDDTPQAAAPSDASAGAASSACAAATAAWARRSGSRTSVRPASGRSRWPTTRRRGPDPDPLRDRGPRRPGSGGTSSSSRSTPSPARSLPVGSTPLRRRRPAGAGPRRRPALDQGRHPQPLAELQGPGRRRRRGARGRVRRPGARLRLDREPRRRDGRGGGGRRAAGLRVHPGRPRAGQGRPRPRLRRDGRARSRAPTTT